MEKLIVIMIVIVFGIVQSIIKAANEAAKKQQVRADPGRKQQVQSEIESFLAEVSGKQAVKRGDAQMSGRQQRRKSQRQKQQQEAKRRQTPARSPQPPALSKRRRVERKVGSGVSDHVNEYITKHVSDHIDHDVEEYVEATIVDNVDEHLGFRDMEMPMMTTAHRKGSSPAAAVAALLRNPAGVRNAILINEILSRPASLRRR